MRFRLKKNLSQFASCLAKMLLVQHFNIITEADHLQEREREREGGGERERGGGGERERERERERESFVCFVLLVS